MEIRPNEPLKNHTTFGVGGCCRRFVIAEEEELPPLLKEKHLILGNGSNLLVSSKGFDGDVIRLLAKEPVLQGNRIIFSAGQTLASAANFAQERGLSGMECLHGIPGTVGGAAVMNAGAYGGELKDVLFSAKVMEKNGQIKEVRCQDLDLSYRHSVIPEKEWVVLSVTLELEQGDPDRIRSRMEELMQRRLEKQPLDKKSAGSTFKRPPGHFAGKLIQEAGCMGLSVGGAAVSEKHAGFVINRGDATAEDIYRLISLVRCRVREQSGVDLECEVKFIGDFSECDL